MYILDATMINVFTAAGIVWILSDYKRARRIASFTVGVCLVYCASRFCGVL